MTLTPSRLAEIEALVPWLRNMAEAGAKALNFMAASKTTRNRAAGDLNSDYGIMTPQQTQEWKAAEAIYELLASHAALAAEVERLRAICVAAVNATDGGATMDVSTEFLSHLPTEVAAIKAQRNEARQQLTTAREAGAREMREACIEITRKFMCREDTVIGAEEIEAEIIALPLTPADGAKDE